MYFFDTKSLIVAAIIILVGFMAWPVIFYITPVVSAVLFIVFYVSALKSDSPGSAAGYLGVFKYLTIPSVISILYILITHIRFA